MKKLLLAFSFLGLLGVLAACGGGEADTEAPVISGVDDATILRDTSFDALEGVSATDNVDGDVTSAIEVAGSVDIEAVGTYFLRYSVSDEAGNTREETRYITVEVDTSTLGDEMVPNGNFDLGWAVWSATTGLEGGVAEYTVSDDGVLEIDIASVAGAEWEPRLENNGITFENGTTYEVSFDAWADAPRPIKVQVGELLDGPPYFTDFKPGQRHVFDIGTDADTYSFKFTMGLDTNENGSLLFEMGTVLSDTLGTDNVVTKVYMDNVAIVEAEADPDTSGPALTGVRESIALSAGASFDPLAGVTGFDVTDGDVTDAITVVITDADGAEVTLDTSVTGTYTITYTAEDSLGNVTEETATLVISSFTYTATDKIVNGDFSGDDLAPFTNFIDGSAEASIALNDGAVDIDVVNGGQAFWAVQFIHADVALEEGVTYQLAFDAKASVARDISAVFFNADTGINYLQSGPIMLTTELETYEFMFTASADITTQLQFLMGMTADFAAGVVTLDNIVLSTLDADPIVDNADFTDNNWTAFHNDWEGSAATINTVDGEVVYTLNNYNNTGPNWLLQLIYNTQLSLEPNTDYIFTMDAYASEEATLIPVFTQGEPAGFNNFASGEVVLTTEKQTFEVAFTTGEDMALTVEFKFEFGNTFESFDEGSKVLYFDNFSLKVDEADAPELLVNTVSDYPVDWEWFTEGDATGTVSVDNGVLTVDVTGVGAQAYQPHLFQMIGDLDAGTYTVKMVMESAEARDLRFNLLLPDAGFASLLADTFYDFSLEASEVTTISFSFTLENAVTNVKLELDFGALGDDYTSITGPVEISEIDVYRNFGTGE